MEGETALINLQQQIGNNLNQEPVFNILILLPSLNIVKTLGSFITVKPSSKDFL